MPCPPPSCADMAERRLIYLAAAFGCLVFYWAYREWLSWVLLMVTLGLPWVSLVLSLPAMLLCRVELRCPNAVTAGDRVPVAYAAAGLFPPPAIKGRVRVKRMFTGKTWRPRLGAELPTDHCGGLELISAGLWVCDYLGLFCLPVRGRDKKLLMVRPKPVALEEPPDMSRYLVNAWKPKPGGGYSENHELRLYRPGDNLHQVHWKLSAKTGKMILREPMEAIRGLSKVTLELRGTPRELDEKLGKLRWVSLYLLQKEVPHQIQCLTGRGMVELEISGEGDVLPALDTLLKAPVAEKAAQPEYGYASWRYHIGGGSDEE